VDTYSGMELCTPIWLNHDHGDGGVVDISAVDAYSRVEVCMPIFLIHKSFSKNLQNSNGHISSQSSTQTRVAMLIIFGSGRNVYVVEEPF
jgi:hypothetical protein